MEGKNMKRTKLFAILFAAAILLPLTSCLKEQADVFEVPSSQRMQNFLEGVRKTLQEPKNGWALSYYPGSSSATCYMAVKFEAQQVAVIGESAPAETVRSSYKLTTDDGAVLSFDTYNSVLHYYATADSEHYQARGGDFEFDIVKADSERIVLRGKRSRNFCYLDPLPDDKGAAEFLEEMVAAKDALSIVAFEGEITGGLVEGFLDGTSNTLSIGRKGAESTELVSVRYMIVPGGTGATSAIHINEPFTFQGVTFQDFEYKEDTDDSTKGTFTGSGITFQKVIPEGFVPYDYFIGKWTFYWNDGASNFPVELVAFEPGTSFKMKGLSTYFEPVLGYNAARGYLTWNYQEIGTAGGLTIILAPWDSAAGYLTWTEGVGLEGHAVDNSAAAVEIEFSDNGIWENYVADSWLLWTLNGTSSAGASDWTFASGSYQLPGALSMVKIVE